MSRPVYLALPSAISTNGLYSNVPGVGRRATKEYKSWKRSAAAWLHQQGPLPFFDVPVVINIYAGEVGVGNMDSDNAAKAMIDALKKAGVIKDDSRKYVRGCSVRWVPALRGSVVRVSRAAVPIIPDEILFELTPIGRGLLA